MTIEILPVGAMTPDEAASYVNEAWRGSVAAIIETGRRLIEAKSRVPHGDWGKVIDLLPFAERSARMLMATADNQQLANPEHAAVLPPDYTTLSILAALPEGQVAAQIEAGVITPEMDRKQARELVRSVREAERDEASHAEQAEPDPVGTTTIFRHDGTELKVPAIKGAATFNRTNDQVSWADWTWNPVHGCLHACAYCYAWEMSELRSFQGSYPEGFAPMFRPERLSAPVNTRLPVEGSDASRRVFVSSMGDLFGEWVPQEWIIAVMEACVKAPDWTYLFLTKFPQRYARLTLPPSIWLGTSVDTQKRVRIAEKAMAKVPDTAVRWLSCEPLLEPVVFSDLSWCDWLVIGSQSAAHGEKEFAPPLDWVVNLIAQARGAGVPVYCKPNLLGVVGPQAPGMDLPREMPRQA